MKLNPHEAPKGYIAKQGTGSRFDDCPRCAFASRYGCLPRNCLKRRRTDGCNVYFVKAPKRKPVIAWVFTANDYPHVTTTRRAARSGARYMHRRRYAVRGPVMVVLP
jgi:hypothetical protein